MYSFTSINGERVNFESRYNISLETINDVVSGEITGYLVNIQDGPTYEVNEETFNALDQM